MQSRIVFLSLVITTILLTTLPSISNSYAITSTTISSVNDNCNILFGAGSWDAGDNSCTISSDYSIPADNRIVTNGFVLFIIDSGVTFTISENTEFLASGPIENGGTIVQETSSLFVSEALLTNDGDISIGGDFDSNGGDIINNGFFENDDTFSISGTFTNDSDIENYGTFDSLGFMDNQGTIYNEGELQLTTTNNDGEITCEGCDEIDITGIVTNNGDLINAGGNMQTDANGVVNNFGTFDNQEDSEFTHNGLIHTEPSGTTINGG